MKKIDIKTALCGIGILPGYKGFKYLIEAAKMYKDSDGVLQLIRDIYPAIAQKYGDKPIRVERAMRYAIEVADRLKRLDKYPWEYDGKERYSTKEFISLLAIFTEI